MKPAEETYKLETFKSNAMIIFNHYKVDRHEKRVGTKQDGKRVKETLEKFGFLGEEHKDPPKTKILKELCTFSSMNFTDYGCVVVVVMTHGKNKGILMSKDEPYNEQDILNFFKREKNNTLVNKPVILIIQACRGSDQQQHSRLEEELTEAEHYQLLLEDDTIVLHSSSINKDSYRDPDGTWFIKSLCEHIEELSTTHHLQELMIEVKRNVAVKSTCCINNKLYQQMPVISSALTRKLYFRKWEDKPVYVHDTYHPYVNKINDLRLMPFLVEDPALWFVKIEGLFSLNGVISDEIKFNYVITQLENRYAVQVADIIKNPPHLKKYDKLKKELIQQRLIREVMGNRKPSQFLQHLKSFAGTGVSEDDLLTLWLEQLPYDIKSTVLPLKKKISLGDMGDLADRVYKLMTTQT